jgi:hypothetical protein
MVSVTGEGQFVHTVKLNGRVLTPDSDPDELFRALEAMARVISNFRYKERRNNVKSREPGIRN